MSPVALPSSPPAELAGCRDAPTELGDAEYAREVLGRSDGATEADIERELMARAAALGMDVPSSGRLNTQELGTSGGNSDNTLALPDGRAVSTGSDGTAVSRVESRASRHSTANPATCQETSGRRRSRSLSFSQYDKYLSQVDPALDQPKFQRNNANKTEWSGGVVIKSNTRRGVKGFTRSIANRLRRRRPSPAATTPMPCICCREDFTSENNALQTLPCGHTYCRECLAVMITQSMADESKMPPRCCTQPIPSAIIKLVLPRDKQQLFLKTVVQYSTPWEVRIFCPNAPCGEFIPPAARVDPKHPFEAVCKNCKTSVCVMCKRGAHQLGQDCPDDRDLDTVLKMGEQSGWRRCYKCRTLVELAQGCTHITCRCKAQFCYICGAVWDPAVGCPNFCNGEEELERRRAEEEARLAELEAEKLALEKAEEAEETARQEAEKNTAQSDGFKALRKEQEAEMARFRIYEQKTRETLRVRQSHKKRALEDKLSDLIEKMRERHAKTEQHLEDRQVMAEIELQAHLEEKEKKVRLKLKYMEDYCHGTGPSSGNEANNNNDELMPLRQVTDRDREQLRQQYCVRDGMERRHQSQINGLREKQAKSMEELVERHEREMEALVDRRAEEIEDLAVEFANEEEVLLGMVGERRARLERRWVLEGEVLRVELERREGKRFAAMGRLVWDEGGIEEEGEREEPDVVDESLAAAAAAAVAVGEGQVVVDEVGVAQ